MARIRTLASLLLLIAVAAALALWAAAEGRQQRREVAAGLADQASLLARSLAPALASAASAEREIDDVVAGKLLDNARLIAALHERGGGEPSALAEIAESNGLDAVLVLDGTGAVLAAAGDAAHAGDPAVAGDLGPLLAGSADELVLGTSSGGAAEHLRAAVAARGGGAVVVQVHRETARAFSRRLGVANLLQRLIGASGVLYLAYREEPGAVAATATWDGGALPAPRDPAAGPRALRGREVFEVTTDVPVPAGHRGTLRVGLDAEPLRRAAATARRRTVLVGLVLAGLGLAAAGFAVVTRSRAAERQEAARRLAEAEEARRASERLAAAGALTAGLAHEVRSPLNAIGLAAQRLERAAPDGAPQSALAATIRVEVKRLEGVLREFLDLARPVAEERRPVDLGELAREVLALLEAEAEQQGVELAPPARTAVARGDSEALRRALINLVRNAVQASTAGGRVEVTCRRDGDRVTLEVLDRGHGVPPELLAEVVEPFVTTRVAGTGLGLAMVRRVAEAHEGRFELRNRDGAGAVARLELPAEGGAR